MKIFKIIKIIPKAIRMGFVFKKALELQTNGKDKEAFYLLEKHKELLKDKFFKYHLYRGRLLIVAYDDCKKAIEEFSQGISLIDSDRKIKPDTREYLLAWAKYMISWCYNELNEKDSAEHWQSESEKHHFDADKVPLRIINLYPWE